MGAGEDGLRLPRFSLAVLVALLAAEVAIGQQEETPLIDFSELNEGSIGEVMRRTGMSADELLLLAAKTADDPAVIDLLVAQGADLNCTERFDNGRHHWGTLAPIHWAAYTNPNPAITEALIRNGSFVDTLSSEASAKEPLHWAAMNNTNPEVVGVLIKHGADVNSKNPHGVTPIHYAAGHNDHRMLQYLADKGADIRAITNNNMEPIHHAAQDGDTSNLKFFLDNGIDINLPGLGEHSPLNWSIISGNQENAFYLLNNGADPNSKSKNKVTPMHLAVATGWNRDLIQSLLANGAEINPTNEFKSSTLSYAIRFDRKPSQIKELLELGASPKFSLYDVYFISKRLDCKEVLQLLEDYGGWSYPLRDQALCGTGGLIVGLAYQSVAARMYVD